MFYFIPAWFGKDRFWEPERIPWYFAEKKIEFDDSLHQMRMFHQQGKDTMLILLSYQPHLRYFLHRQDAFEVNHYSIFDSIQGIKEPEMRPIQIREMNWDAECDFIYTPFAIRINRNGEKYAHIELGIEGFVKEIRYFQSGQIEREELYDDRGFVSSVLYYENAEPSYRYYYNTAGEWQICEYLDSRGVVVNPTVAPRFRKTHYSTLAELIWEFFGDFFHDRVQIEDVFVLASDQRHNATFYQQLPKINRKILTFFVERNKDDRLEEYGDLLSKTTLLISDRKDLLNRLKSLYPDQANKMHQLTSFDTRLALGKSQRVKESKIFYQVDMRFLSEEDVYQVLKFVGKYPSTSVVFGTFNASPHEIRTLQYTIHRIVEERLDITDFEEEKEDQAGAENKLAENVTVAYRYTFVNLQDELGLIKELEYTRLIVDLNPTPILYTQIAGISAGIPQVNQTDTEYISHLKNGYVLHDSGAFSEAALYFLGRLKYWNQALIDSVEKIKENTGERLVQKWENWLKEEQ